MSSHLGRTYECVSVRKLNDQSETLLLSDETSRRDKTYWDLIRLAVVMYCRAPSAAPRQCPQLEECGKQGKSTLIRSWHLDFIWHLVRHNKHRGCFFFLLQNLGYKSLKMLITSCLYPLAQLSISQYRVIRSLIRNWAGGGWVAVINNLWHPINTKDYPFFLSLSRIYIFHLTENKAIYKDISHFLRDYRSPKVWLPSCLGFFPILDDY